MRFGSLKLRSLYKSGSLTTVARELARNKLDLVGVHEVRWDKSDCTAKHEHSSQIHRYVHSNMNIPNVNSLTSDDRFIHICVIMLSVTSWLSLFSVCHISGADSYKVDICKKKKKTSKIQFHLHIN